MNIADLFNRCPVPQQLPLCIQLAQPAAFEVLRFQRFMIDAGRFIMSVSANPLPAAGRLPQTAAR